MPSNTAGGWPYPLPTEPVRDGAVAIGNLATEAEKRFANQMTVGIYGIGAFDVNGLWYAPDWRTAWGGHGGINWTSAPAVVAMAGMNTTGADAGLVINTYQPHITPQQLVLQAHYAKDGRALNGSLDLYIIATGIGKRI